MKIGVCIKQVPSRESELTPAADGRWIGEPDGFDSSEPDNYALEAALQLKEQQGGEVVAVLLGPDSASEVVKTALAKGADRAIHIIGEALETLDPLQTAGLLAAAARDEQFDLILTGLQSDDQGFAQTGVLLAELLDLPHASVVVDIALEGQRLAVKRELEGGWSQRVWMDLPALLTVQSGINSPRYATFKGIIAAKKKTIDSVAAADIAPAELQASQSVLRLYVPQQSKQTEMLAGTAAEQAAGLVDKLRNEARVL